MWTFLREVYPLLHRRQRRGLAVSVIAAILLAALEALGLALLFPLLQLIAHADGTGTVALPVIGRIAGASPGWLGTVAFAAFVAKGVLGVVVLRRNVAFVLNTEAEGSAELLEAYLRAPYVFHLHTSSADLQQRINDSLRRINEEGLGGAISAMADGVGIAAIALVLLIAQPTVAVFAAVYFLVVGLGYQRLVHGRVERAGAAMAPALSAAFAAVQQSLATYKELRLRNVEDHFVGALRRARHASVTARRTVIVLSQAPRYYLELVLLVGVGLLAAILFRTQTQADAVGALGFFVAAGLRFLPALNRVIVGQNIARASVPPLREVAADLRRFPLETTRSATASPMDDSIEFVSVGFSHIGADAPVLREVSFRIEPGSTVAFVGRSGAGKTTTLDLLLGFLDASHGEVLVGGVRIDTARSAWQRRIGYVPQSVVLLDATLEENIALGLDPLLIDEELVDRAVAEAQLGDVVAHLPGGLHAQIGEGGVRLSGGQRQRVGLARALYHRPSVLVLDEATSALDSETEARFAQALTDLGRTMTLVMVAHRLSTVVHADRIFYFADGRIRSQGTFEDLQRQEPEFRELVRLGSLPGASAEPAS